MKRMCWVWLLALVMASGSMAADDVCGGEYFDGWPIVYKYSAEGFVFLNIGLGADAVVADDLFEPWQILRVEESGFVIVDAVPWMKDWQVLFMVKRWIGGMFEFDMEQVRMYPFLVMTPDDYWWCLWLLQNPYELGLPGTVFVPDDDVDDDCEYPWWDEYDGGGELNFLDDDFPVEKAAQLVGRADNTKYTPVVEVGALGTPGLPPGIPSGMHLEAMAAYEGYAAGLSGNLRLDGKSMRLVSDFGYDEEGLIMYLIDKLDLPESPF